MNYNPEKRPSDTLNEKQLEAVTNTKPLLVIAGAGTGKTKVITHKVAYLIKHEGCHPDNILAITFTNKAAKEMKERLKYMLPTAPPQNVTTFHAFCLRILKHNIHIMGEPYNTRFTIADEKDSRKLIERISAEMNNRGQKKKKDPNPTLSLFPELQPPESNTPETYKSIDIEYAACLISRAKQQYCTDVAHAIRLTTAPSSPYPELAQRYQQQMRSSNAMDFDDMMQNAYAILLHHPNVRKKWASMFQFILIDEYQDTNQLQNDLIQILYDDNTAMGICAVADPQQTIYTWRGADPRNVFDFIKRYGAQEVRLEQNYRSGRKILSIANKIASNLTGEWRDKVLQLWTSSDLDGYVDYTTYRDGDEESDTIAQNIKSIVAAGYRHKDIAILCRIGSTIDEMSRTLMDHGIPHETVGATSFAKRTEIKDMVAYLRLLLNPRDKGSFLRIINTPKRELGQKTVDDIVRKYDTDWITTIQRNTFSQDKRSNIDAFVSLYTALSPHAETRPYETLMALIKAIEYEKHLNKTNPEKAAEKMENLSRLANMLKRDQDAGVGLTDFLDRNAMSADQDHLTDHDTVKIMTVHAAKGLEFPAVIIPVLEEYTFPCSKALETTEATDEERRCFYVAVTRAKEMLYLSNARTRSSYGSQKTPEPSRYISEIAQTAN